MDSINTGSLSESRRLMGCDTRKLNCRQAMSSRKRPAGADEGPKRSDLDNQVEPLLESIESRLRGKGFSKLPRGGFEVFRVIERHYRELTDRANRDRMSHYNTIKTAIQELGRQNRVTVRPIINEDIATICAAIAARNRNIHQHVNDLYDHMHSHGHRTQQQRADDEEQKAETYEILKKEYDTELEANLAGATWSDRRSS
jgi:hypothetical protein